MEDDRKDEEAMPGELAAAIAEFKAKPGYRHEAAKTILPFIRAGMSRQEVVDMLGQPSAKVANDTMWRYGLFYSQLLEIHFGPDGRVTKVGPVGLAEEE